MYSLETLALLGTHDTGWRQTQKHNTTQKSKKMRSNMYKYQTQNRWQPLVACMHHMGTCEGEICGSSSVNLHQPETVFSSRAPGFWWGPCCSSFYFSVLLLGTHDTGWRQTNTKAQHNTAQKSKKMSNMGLTKIQVLAKRKQFLVDEEHFQQSTTLTISVNIT
jgi:hypothetical protein